jgi:F-box protein 9
MNQEPKLPASSDTETAAVVAQVIDDLKEDSDVELDDSSPLWNREDEGWELTWPIWHMLPWYERKAIAKRHGYTSIGAFEEYMSLQLSLGDSEVTNKRPYANEEIYGKDLQSTPGAGASFQKTEAKKLEEEEEDEDSDSDDNADYRRQVSACTEDLSLEELLLVGGKILMLDDEMLHQVFSWLPVDTYGTLAMVSPHWKHLTRTELVYKRLCERLYLNQSKRRQLHVSRFGGSYRTMLEQRPRVRAAGGCYVLKYTQVKKIQRDMWTEVSQSVVASAAVASF